MRAVFNSLGSNYSSQFIGLTRKLLWKPWSWKDTQAVTRLRLELNDRFGGVSTTFYKGRAGITAALKAFGIGKGDLVLTQAFTCWAVEEGIRESGADPIFVDVAAGSLNMSVETLIQKSKIKNLKAVLVQHTLGYQADIKAIKQFCEKNNLVLIEDLAHAAGAEGVGKLADAVVLSFGRDKIIDGVSGGAVVFKNHESRIKNQGIKNLKQVSFWQTMRDLKYPLVTKMIRTSYWFGAGKLIHYLLTKTGYMKSPIFFESTGMMDLSGAHAELASQALRELKSNVIRRRKIASIYYKELRNWSPMEASNWKQSSCLRYPVLVKDKQGLIKRLKKDKVYAGDIWYKAAVDEGSNKLKKSSYKMGSCRQVESLAKGIVNLPTHREISGERAKEIAKIVRTYV